MRWKKGDKTKYCPGCCAVKSVDQFNIRKLGSETRQSQCRDCHNEINLRWASENRDQATKSTKLWRSKNIERCRANQRALVAKDPERFRAYSRKCYYKNWSRYADARREQYQNNKELAALKYREWRIKNPARNAFKAMQYEARKRKAKPSWADDQKIFEIYALCAEMNKRGATKFHVDHIYPLCSPIMCGLHVHENLQILTATENQKKSNKVLDVWQTEIASAANP